MAQVHLAIAHGASGFERQVAINHLAPELAGEPELERALIREATRAGTLRHRNLGFASVDELRRAVAEAQRLRAPATAIDLGDWVKARLAVGRGAAVKEANCPRPSAR